MATTTFEELYSDFLFKVQDYQQRNLYLRDVKVATNLCLSFLKTAIAKFTNCKKDIQNPNLDLCVFNVELTLTEKDILTNLMVEAWLNRVCLDITQMNLTLNDNDFKHFAEEKNLEKKIETRITVAAANGKTRTGISKDRNPEIYYALENGYLNELQDRGFDVAAVSSPQGFRISWENAK